MSKELLCVRGKRGMTTEKLFKNFEHDNYVRNLNPNPDEKEGAFLSEKCGQIDLMKLGF